MSSRQVKTDEVDGYTSVQLAFDPVAERKLARRQGHLKRAGKRASASGGVPRGIGELQVGETVTVGAFQPGDKIKVSGVSIGKGFQGTIKRHNFKRGPVRTRLAQRSQAGLDRRLPRGRRPASSRARMAGRMGGKRRTQVGLVVRSVDPELNLLLVKGSVHRARRAGCSRSASSADGRSEGTGARRREAGRPASPRPCSAPR